MERTFKHLAESWYATANITRERVDEIAILIDNGVRQADFYVEWRRFALRTSAPQFVAADDAWWAFPVIADVIAFMAIHKNPDPEDFCTALKVMGFADTTVRVEPHNL